MPVAIHQKLRELILYTTERSEGDSAFSADKLKALLCFIDFSAYAQGGSSVSGHSYVRGVTGPEPARFREIVDEMVSAGEIAIRRGERFDKQSRRLFALQCCDLDTFSSQEVDRINSAVQVFHGIDAVRLIESHLPCTGWELADEGELIPYELALVGRRRPTPHELTIGRKLAADCVSQKEPAETENHS